MNWFQTINLLVISLPRLSNCWRGWKRAWLIKLCLG
ncbi:Uncharacterised protein [Vibrio cholerae]|nr:Uncharacterised protein [Vibrio cholerae]CSI77634.1 Uncharacterised protein [Vibrio cholerae]